MTEPKWRHIDTVTEGMFFEGNWYCDSRSWTTDDATFDVIERWKKYGYTYVFGPVPEPPKPPPKPRRFTAKHEMLGLVSGVHFKEDTTEFNCLVFSITSRGNVSQDWESLDELTDIKWLDPED